MSFQREEATQIQENYLSCVSQLNLTIVDFFRRSYQQSVISIRMLFVDYGNPSLSNDLFYLLYNQHTHY